MLPRTLTVSLSQLNLTVLTVLASLLNTGSVAVFNLASNLFMVPVALVGVSYAVAAFPTLAEQAAAGAEVLFRRTVQHGVQLLLLCALPATVLLVLLRAQLVRATLGAGAFDWTDTVLTFQVLQWLALGLFAHMLHPFLTRVLYARHDTVTPLVAGLGATLVGTSLSVALFAEYGVTGLAIGFTVGAVVNVACLWVSLRWQYGSFGDSAIVRTLAQATVASFVMAIVTQGTKAGSGVLLGTDTFLRIVAQGVSAAVAGGAAFLATLYLLRSPELSAVAAAVRQRARPRAEVVGEGISDLGTPAV
jgi:putative peptidoglycan lipid II flippase